MLRREQWDARRNGDTITPHHLNGVSLRAVEHSTRQIASSRNEARDVHVIRESQQLSVASRILAIHAGKLRDRARRVALTEDALCAREVAVVHADTNGALHAMLRRAEAIAVRTTRLRCRNPRNARHDYG